jgi:hypothetical protein
VSLDRGGLAAAGGVRAGSVGSSSHLLARLVADADSVVALTGAGISVLAELRALVAVLELA